MRSASALATLALALTPLISSAQDFPAHFESAVVNPDHTITFKYLDPAATKVSLAFDGAPEAQPMTKGADNVWTATTPAKTPQIYGYHFQVDGMDRLDPKNTDVTTNLLDISNLLDVPGDTPQPWEPQNIPHGEVHHHIYTTSVVTGLAGNQSDFFVYTPPGYDPKSKKDYPVLYLLHGFSDDASGWTVVGKANLILDSLIAQGKAKPMLVVMTLGYGQMSFVRNGGGSWHTPDTVASNTSGYQQALLTEVLPRVESSYRVSKKREDRAIAGLSMGGLESLSVGLNNTDKFAYVVGLSSAAASVDRTKLASLDPKSANLKLLWIACGTEDHLLQPNRDFITFLKSKNMPVTAIETPGMHDWMVWRDNLTHFAPLLFQK